jgi:hypothetical protein
MDTLSSSPVRTKIYDCASACNRGHQRFARASLVMGAFADVYVRLCSRGIWTDVRIF